MHEGSATTPFGFSPPWKHHYHQCMQMMPGRDRISQLPTEILDNILGFLPIVEAARTIVLSTIWGDIWSSLTQLNFDNHFFSYIRKKYSESYADTSAGLYVINKVLMLHKGPIRKFSLNIEYAGPIADEPFYFDHWFLFITQKGVVEMNLVFTGGYKLPNCIFSCLTLKRLCLYGVIVEPIKAPCIFPNVTSLSFDGVRFDHRNLLDCGANAPLLETLIFNQCGNAVDFNITAPGLKSLTVWDSYCVDDCFLPINLDLTSIHTMDLAFDLKHIVKEFRRRGLQPPELNVEYLKCSPDYNGFFAFTRSLRICPKLCKLDIRLQSFLKPVDATISICKLWVELQRVAQTLKMLHTFKLSSFTGSRFEMQFIKVLLAYFPQLEKVVIIKNFESKEINVMQKILEFPRASTKARITFI